MAGSRRLAGVLARLVLLSASLALVLAFAEVAARVLVGPPPTGGHHELLCEHDPLLGWSKVPNAKKRYITSEYDIEERINSKGLRGPEHPYERSGDGTRVLVLGDSYTEGYTVDFEAVFSEVLRRQLDASSPDGGHEVINAGTGGYSTDQELLFFRSEGARYRPDLVILMFVVNDVWFNAQAAYPRAPKPLFRLEGDELVLTNVPLAEPPPREEPQAHEGPPSPLQRLKLALTERSTLYRFVRDRVKNNYWLHATAIRLGLAEAPDAETGVLAVPDAWTVFKRTPPPPVEEAWELTEALLLALAEEVAALGAELLIVNVPSSFEVYEDGWSAIRRKYGISDAEWSPTTVGERLRAFCRARGLEFLDLRPAFVEAARAGSREGVSLYFPIDGHWNEAGHRLAGETIAGHLAAREASR